MLGNELREEKIMEVQGNSTRKYLVSAEPNIVDVDTLKEIHEFWQDRSVNCRVLENSFDENTTLFAIAENGQVFLTQVIGMVSVID